MKIFELTNRPGLFRGSLPLASLAIIISSSLSFADTVVEDFESGLGDFTFVDNDGSNAGKFGTVTGVNPTTEAAEGLAAHVGDGVNFSSSLPGAWLQADAFEIDPTQDFTLEFNVKFEQEFTFDDATILLGDLANGTYYTFALGENPDSNNLRLFQNDTLPASNTADYGNPSPFVNDTWYRAVLTWVAGTETLSLNVTTILDQVTSLASFSVVLDDGTPETRSLTDIGANLRVGFGTFNDRASYDNITADGAGISAPSDTDMDGMTDEYEIANGLDPSDDGSIDFNNGASGNLDGDGLTNFQEFAALDANDLPHGFGSTRADLADTDGDELDDDVEVSGANNAFQTAVAGDTPTSAPGLATDPNLADSDGDGLLDGEETSGSENISNANAATNPNVGDTDDDEMDDKYEVENNNGGSGGLDPNTDDAAGNLDGDSGPLSNLDEYLGLTLGVRTRADKLDTDDDGYLDTSEDNFGSWGSPTTTGTNPAIADSDGDGLLDGEENLDLALFPGLGVFPTNSDPNEFDSDFDGLSDNDEASTTGTDPTLSDTDGDGSSDTGELFIFGTDPIVTGDAPSAAQLAELRVNFQETFTIAELAEDFQHYTADHEVLSSFGTKQFSAFGGTDNIDVTLSWDDGGTAVNMEAPQMISRTATPPEFPLWRNLFLDWAGTDARADKAPGDPMTVTIGGLPAGTYLWTSYHIDSLGQTGAFEATFSSASGTSGPTTVDPLAPIEGVSEFSDVVTYQQVFTSDGSDVTVEFDQVVSEGAINLVFFHMNAFIISNTNIPVGGGLKVTGIAFESGTGDLLVDFEPGGSGYTLKATTDLATGTFTAISGVTLENGDTAFRVPAAELNGTEEYFRVEEN